MTNSLTQRAGAVGTLAVLLTIATIGAGIARADLPGRHPYYLHALSDLRAARWLLEHRQGDAAVSGHEDVAIQKVDAALYDIKQGAIDDGKDIHNHPNVGVPNEQAGRLQKAEEFLEQARSNVNREEDDPTAKSLKHRSFQDIDLALAQTKSAIWDVRHHR